MRKQEDVNNEMYYTVIWKSIIMENSVLIKETPFSNRKQILMNEA